MDKSRVSQYLKWSGYDPSNKKHRSVIRGRLMGVDAENALRFEARATRKFGPATGIFVRQLLFWDGKGRDEEGWVYKSGEEWTEETGLSRSNQETARRKLIKAGALEEELRGLPARLYYRLDLRALAAALDEELEPPKEGVSGIDSSLRDSSKQGCENPANKDAETPQTSLPEPDKHIQRVRQESTPESTTESSSFQDGADAFSGAPPPPKKENKKEGFRTDHPNRPEPTIIGHCCAYLDDHPNLPQELSGGRVSVSEAAGKVTERYGVSRALREAYEVGMREATGV